MFPTGPFAPGPPKECTRREGTVNSKATHALDLPHQWLKAPSQQTDCMRSLPEPAEGWRVDAHVDSMLPWYYLALGSVGRASRPLAWEGPGHGNPPGAMLWHSVRGVSPPLPVPKRGSAGKCCPSRMCLALGDSEPPALCDVPHTGGDERPTNFTALGNTSSGTCQRRHGRRRGAEAAPVSRGTTVQLSPTKNTSSHCPCNDTHIL